LDSSKRDTFNIYKTLNTEKEDMTFLSKQDKHSPPNMTFNSKYLRNLSPEVLQFPMQRRSIPQEKNK